VNILGLIHFSQVVLPRFRPPEITGAQWVGNSTQSHPGQAVRDYQGLQQWQRCGYCLFAIPFQRGSIRWAIYSEIRDGIRENGVHQ
jgi:hypothetical protein